MRPFTTFVGIDLGGARGKTTAIATLSLGDGGAIVDDVAARHDGQPWTDEVVLDFVSEAAARGPTIVAIDAPLTEPACVRCHEAVCPGQAVCAVPAVVWLRTRGAELHSAATQGADRIVAIPSSAVSTATSFPEAPSKAPMAPYSHRCTEVVLHFETDVLSRDAVGQGTGPLSARAGHLRRALSGRGFVLNRDLIEVSPRATVNALFGERRARGYKRDADPWMTRAAIIEDLGDSLGFGPRSRLSREEVLRNDHCFEALLCAYTAYLFTRDEWTMPDDPVFAEDGWIWAPPKD